MTEQSDRIAGSERSATASTVVIVESTGRWGLALRRELTDTRLRLVETRTPDEFLATVGRHPSSFAIVEIAETNIQRGLTLLLSLEREFHATPVIVVAQRRFKRYEWLVREMGAVHFLTSTRRLTGVAEILRNHFSRQPGVEVSLTERILSDLPWDG